MYYALAKNERFTQLKSNLIEFFFYNENVTDGTVQNVFKCLDQIQLNTDCYTEIHYEDDGGITISLEKDNGFILDIYTHELMNIMWLQKEGEEVFYKENLPLQEIFKQIEKFEEE